jgi:AraC-like DNA-binding protein
MGTAVTTVAMDLGYESPSAFTAMFRRVMGKTPKHYLGRCDLDMG